MSEPSDQFKSEVLSQGPEACLPCNLSDEWLHLLLVQATTGFEPEDPGKDEYMAALWTILISQSEEEDGKVAISEDRLYDLFGEYAFELGLEHASRAGELKAAPATLETIFVRSTVPLTRQPDQ